LLGGALALGFAIVLVIVARIVVRRVRATAQRRER
jgi:hypothetical protein